MGFEDDKAMLIYNSGDGDDVINGFDSTDTLSITGGSYVRSTVGSDVVVRVGSGSILLQGAADKTIYIAGTQSITSVGTTINNSLSNRTLTSTSYADLIVNQAEEVTINAGGANDSISGVYMYSSINSGAGDDYIIARGGFYSMILGGSGNDTLGCDHCFLSYVSGGANDDIIIVLGYSNIISGDSTTKSGADIIVTVGDGKITLSGAASLSTLNIAGTLSSGNEGTSGNDSITNTVGGVSINALGGNDTIVNAGDSVTIEAGAGNDEIFNGNLGSNSNGGENVSISGGAGNDEIRNWHGNNATLLGGTGDDALINSYGDKVFLAGNAGDDSISLGEDATNNLILYSSGDGNDLIQGFRADSTLQIGGGTGTYSKETVDSDIIVTVGDGTITLAGAASLDAINIDGTEPVLLTTLTNDDNDSMTLSGGLKNIDASARTKSIEITGNALDNSIVGGKVADTLSGGAGNDTLTGGRKGDLFIYTAGNDVITDYSAAAGDKVSIAGNGAKYLSHITGVETSGNNVKLTFSKDSSKTLTLNGAARYFDTNQIIGYDKKTVTLTSAYSGTFDASGYTGVNASAAAQAVTISGANSIVGTTGNDTLTGGYGADTFVYTGGNDVITDYAANFDKIQLNGNTRIFEDGVIYTADKKSSTQAGGSADVYWFDESNFDAPGLDSIMQSPATDYSVGKIKTLDNLTKLSKDEFTLTFGDDR